MKKIGIIGGIGPESTVDYYKQIIAAFQKRGAGLTYPEIIIYSADLSELLAIIENQQWERMTDWLSARVEALHRAGAEFGAIASNTPHAVFDAVQARSPIPLVSIVHAACEAAQQMELKRPGLLGTAFTMGADFYPRAFAQAGMRIMVPDQAAQVLIQQRLFSEIELGVIKESTRGELVAIVKQMIQAQAIDSLILGCTELPLVLDQSHFTIPVLNTTALHAQSIVRHCLAAD
ncbi:MAG: amino acid racemase [Desulfobacteraceae bacterium]|nr:amino acid racemase [Desulfobacteraceae bacterium]